MKIVNKLTLSIGLIGLMSLTSFANERELGGVKPWLYKKDQDTQKQIITSTTLINTEFLEYYADQIGDTSKLQNALIGFKCVEYVGQKVPSYATSYHGTVSYYEDNKKRLIFFFVAHGAFEFIDDFLISYATKPENVRSIKLLHLPNFVGGFSRYAGHSQDIAAQILSANRIFFNVNGDDIEGRKVSQKISFHYHWRDAKEKIKKVFQHCGQNMKEFEA